MPKRLTRTADYPQRRERAQQFRHEPAPMEQRLWQAVRDRKCSGHKIRRQVVIGIYIVDFVCEAAKVILELDGDSHTGQIAYDAARTDSLQTQGYRVVRFTNAEVRDHLEGVLIRIAQECDNAGSRQ